MNKCLEYSKILHTFICEMESTLNDKNKRNRAYASQVFWKNKDTLELIETELKRLEELEKARDMWKDIADNLKAKNEKQDKILRIIKEKGIDTEMFSQLTTYDEYCELCENDEIFRNLFGNYTQEEFDSLKEVLS